MQEVYYVYKLRHHPEFRILADRGRKLTDIEVDVSIAHKENIALGSVKWHKVVVNPLDEAQPPLRPDEAQDNRSSVRGGHLKQAKQASWRKPKMNASYVHSRMRWENLLSGLEAMA